MTRRQIISKAVLARTEDQVADALEALQEYLRANPDDHGIRDVAEGLLMRQRAFRRLARRNE